MVFLGEIANDTLKNCNHKVWIIIARTKRIQRKAAHSCSTVASRWWFQRCFYVHPEPWRNDPIWTKVSSDGLKITRFDWILSKVRLGKTWRMAIWTSRIGGSWGWSSRGYPDDDPFDCKKIYEKVELICWHMLIYHDISKCGHVYCKYVSWFLWIRNCDVFFLVGERSEKNPAMITTCRLSGKSGQFHGD